MTTWTSSALSSFAARNSASLKLGKQGIAIICDALLSALFTFLCSSQIKKLYDTFSHRKERFTVNYKKKSRINVSYYFASA